jgi:hypothetical protein
MPVSPEHSDANELSHWATPAEPRYRYPSLPTLTGFVGACSPDTSKPYFLDAIVAEQEQVDCVTEESG